MKKKLLSSIIVGLSVALGCAAPAMADSRKVVTLGADLTEEQKNTMMRYFGVGYDAVDLIYINNTDEREHLGSYVPLEQIGNYTYSCALVSPTSSGGIQVKTANLDWVTCNMIASTLSTSGVTNCQVVAASPFKVSGTGALTGVIMAYETASQQTLDPVKKDLANQELVVTGNLANEVGQSTATAIINQTKLEVIENNVTNIEEITNIVNNVSNNYNTSLTPDEGMVIAEMMQKIAEQEYDIEQLKATLERVQANVIGDAGASEIEQQRAQEQADAAQAAAYAAGLADGQAAAEAGMEANQEETENILDNTNVEVLEESGAPVVEGDTTTTVLEQEQQTEGQADNGLGIPEATNDGTIAETTAPETDALTGETTVPETDAISVETTAPETDAVTGETIAPETDAVTGETTAPETDVLTGETTAPEIDAVTGEAAETEAELKEEELTDEADKMLYDEVKKALEEEFVSTTVSSEDGSYVTYLTEDAAKALPELIDQYLLKVLIKGSQAVAAEEAADPEISQNIVAETAVNAEDKNYEDEELKQVDKFVRRLIFKDSEKILESSQLTDEDRTFLYNEIMKAFEKAYEVEPVQEETAEETNLEEMPSEEMPSEEVSAEEAPSEEMPVDDGTADMGAEGVADEFADFEEQEGTF